MEGCCAGTPLYVLDKNGRCSVGRTTPEVPAVPSCWGSLLCSKGATTYSCQSDKCWVGRPTLVVTATFLPGIITLCWNATFGCRWGSTKKYFFPHCSWVLPPVTSHCDLGRDGESLPLYHSELLLLFWLLVQPLLFQARTYPTAGWGISALSEAEGSRPPPEPTIGTCIQGHFHLEDSWPTAMPSKKSLLPRIVLTPHIHFFNSRSKSHPPEDIHTVHNECWCLSDPCNIWASIKSTILEGRDCEHKDLIHVTLTSADFTHK